MYGKSIEAFSKFIEGQKSSRSVRLVKPGHGNVTSGKKNDEGTTNVVPAELPVVLLFKDGTDVRINDTARNLGAIYTNMLRLFRRAAGSEGGQRNQVQRLDSSRVLRLFSPDEACSEFESVAQIKNQHPQKGPIHAVFKEADAKRILGSEQFYNRLPLIRIVTKCPVIIELVDEATAVINDYHRESGIFAAGDQPATMDINVAIKTILSIIDEFDFKSPADKSRCIAAIITPALIMGGIGKFRAPIIFVEADESQSGKGFIVKLIASIYNDIVYVINQQNGGVGSLEESLSERLVEGRNFISIDNLTALKKNGVFNSDKLCSLMTEDTFSARVPHKGGIVIDPRLHTIFITTNGCLLSIDLMNRSCPIAIKKRHHFKYKEYPEGSVLDHVRQNSSMFQGAIFTIIQEWVRDGKPRTSTTAHESSFTPWAQSLDWIVQNIMGQAPLLGGYEQVRHRITSPYMQNLRDIALTVIKTRENEWLTVSDILEQVGPTGIKLPGTDAECDYETMTEGAIDNAKRQLGLSFKRAFDNDGHDDVLILDGVRITRKEEAKTYDNGTIKNLKYYNFSDQ